MAIARKPSMSGRYDERLSVETSPRKAPKEGLDIPAEAPAAMSSFAAGWGNSALVEKKGSVIREIVVRASHVVSC